MNKKQPDQRLRLTRCGLMGAFANQTMSLIVLAQHLAGITDTRQVAKITYPLFDILFLTITAVIAGCEGWEEIEDFGHARLNWLKRYERYPDS